MIAKTGMLEREWAMGGIINAQDGTPLTFAVYAIGDGIPDDAPDALDTVVTAAVPVRKQPLELLSHSSHSVM